MKAYADASVIVAAYTVELATVRALAWLADLREGDLLTSDWCRTEIVSALAKKRRVGDIDAAARTAIGAAIRRMLDETAVPIAITHVHFAAATRLLERSDIALRGGDALHLAIAAEAGATLWTFDRRMAEAGEAFGLDARMLA